MPAQFIIDRSPDGQFYFSLQSEKGEVVLISVPFVFRISLLNAIDHVRHYAVDEKYFHRAIAVNGEFFFVLRSADDELLGTSEMYVNASWRDEALQAVQQQAAEAVVEDRTR